ncbi:MAG TPA: plasmid mobilization relaxosome protein MobC [Sphingobacterium sp.]|nr:plasmid mobilization relaxosome protein MobC [Sphingobacterium sp.]
MTRPILDDEDKKSSYIRFRCSPEEKQKIKEYASSLGLSLTDYLLTKALDKTVVVNRLEFMQKFSEVGTEISRCGNNINQLAKHVNSQRKIGIKSEAWFKIYTDMIREYVDSQDELRRTIRKMLRDLRDK